DTLYRTLSSSEITLPFDKHTTSLYSIVEDKPERGRMHQIRIHLAHILHPILADRPYGCNKQNRLWKERFDMDSMMLQAQKLSFTHPKTGVEISIEAPLQSEFVRVREILSL